MRVERSGARVAVAVVVRDLVVDHTGGAPMRFASLDSSADRLTRRVHDHPEQVDDG